jgi:hypothetical protein
VYGDRNVLVTPCYRYQGHPPLPPHSDGTTSFFALLVKVVTKSRLQGFVGAILVDFEDIGMNRFPCSSLWNRKLLLAVLEPMTFLMK